MEHLVWLWASLRRWLSDRTSRGVLDSYWPEGLRCEPLKVVEVDDPTVDLGRDVALPVDVLSVN